MTFSVITIQSESSSIPRGIAISTICHVQRLVVLQTRMLMQLSPGKFAAAVRKNNTAGYKIPPNKKTKRNSKTNKLNWDISKECQTRHWPYHKSECKVILALAKVTDRSVPMAERVEILDSDILRSPANFEIAMASAHGDLMNLIAEDIDVHFGKGAGLPAICWTSYLLSTVFRGKPTRGHPQNLGIFTGLNIAYFLRFLTRDRGYNLRNGGSYREPGPCHREYGDVLAMVMSVTCLLAHTATSHRRLQEMREKWLRPLLRSISSLFLQ